MSKVSPRTERVKLLHFSIYLQWVRVLNVGITKKNTLALVFVNFTPARK